MVMSLLAIRQILSVLLKSHLKGNGAHELASKSTSFDDPDEFIFQQDCASSHTANKTQQYLENHTYY